MQRAIGECVGMEGFSFVDFIHFQVKKNVNKFNHPKDINLIWRSKDIRESLGRSVSPTWIPPQENKLSII